jgi:UDP-N-acetylmuramoyl-tripeptide--D-alanyl-D-alanine ligase
VPLPVRRATRRALTAAAVRAHLARCRSTTLVAVTGSTGKTTLKDLLAAMLAAAGPTVRTRHNDNGLYGTPASLLTIRPEDRFAVIEVAADKPGDVPWVAGLMRPDVAVLTGVGDDHLPHFGNREAIAAEKRHVLARVRRGGTVIVNADDELARRAAAGLRARVVQVGRAADADVRLVDAHLRWPEGLEATVYLRGEPITLTVALHGLHFAPLVAYALAAADACGVPPALAARGAAELFRQSPRRVQPVPGPNGSTLLLDDFKCRLHSALAAVQTLEAAPAERRIVVLGELQERPFTEDAYRPLAEPLARTADRVLAVGRSAGPLRALLGDRAEPVAGVQELADRVRELAAPGVVTLMAGSTAQHLERAQHLLEGREVGCLVTRCALRWSCLECPYLSPGPPERVVEAA